MKKEDVKKFLIVVMALACVVVLMGFVGLAFYARQFFVYGDADLSQWQYNRLVVGVVAVLVLACLVVVSLILLFVLNLVNLSKKHKKIMNAVLMGFICLLSVVMIVLCASVVNPKNFISIYSRQQYISFVGQTLEMAIPAIIFGVSGYFLVFADGIFKNIESENTSQK